MIGASASHRKVVHRFTRRVRSRPATFNGDHHLDVVTRTGQDIALLLGEGPAILQLQPFFPAGPFFTFFSLTVCDVNAIVSWTRQAGFETVL